MTPEERKRYDDDVKFRNAVCEHGSQRRKCNTCELLCEQHDNAALRARIVELEDERDRWYGAAHERMIKINGLESTCRVQAKLIADQRNEIAVALTKIENLKERVTVGRRMDSETIDAKDRTIRRLVDQNNAIQQVDENADLRARIEEFEEYNRLLHDKNHALHERIAKLEKVAEFYANPLIYRQDTVDIGVGDQPIPGTEHVLCDGGRTARAALDALKEG
jgi:hypothetical protein